MQKLRLAIPVACLCVGVGLASAGAVTATGADDPSLVVERPANMDAVVEISAETRQAAREHIAASSTLDNLTRSTPYEIVAYEPWTNFGSTKQVGVVAVLQLRQAIDVNDTWPVINYPDAAGESDIPSADSSYVKGTHKGSLNGVQTIRVWYDATAQEVVAIVPWPRPEESAAPTNDTNEAGD